LVVESGGKKRGRIPEYICHRHRANSSCTNALRVSVAEMNEAVLQGIEEHALTPEAIEKLITPTEQDDVPHHLDALQKEAKDIAKRLARITEAIETGGDIRSLVARIPELEERQQVIASERCPKLR